MNRFYKSSKVRRFGGGFMCNNGVNVVMIVCGVCGEMYEEEVMGVNSDYESVSCCCFCGSYNSI